MTLKMRTISGEYVEVPAAPSGRGRCVMALVRCRMRWVSEQDLITGVVPPDDEGPGTFEDAPTLCSTDGKGNLVAIAAPYDCMSEVYVLQSVDGYPAWRPRREVYGQKKS